MKETLTFSMLGLIALLGVSCTPGERGAVTGGAIGAGIGALAGNSTGALIGGAVGAVAGSEISKNQANKNRGYQDAY
jgi:outer membrane lipoprotein SlyB